MPTVHGSWAPNSSTNQRMRLVLTYSVSTPSSSSTSVTVSGSVRLEVRYGVYDQNNTFAWSGSLLGSGSKSAPFNVPTDGSTTLHTFTTTVPITYSAGSRTVSFSLSGVEYVGASASVSTSVAIPARPVNKPAAPTELTVVRSARNRRTLKWKLHPTNDAPITKVRIQRWRTNDPQWVEAVVLNGDTETWVDTADLFNERYAYRIWAYNYAGEAYLQSDTWGDQPAEAEGLKVTRAGTDVRVEWRINSRVHQHQDLRRRYSTDGGVTWSNSEWIPGHTQFSKDATERTVTGMAADRLWQIGVTAANGDVPDGSSLYGHSAWSPTLQLLTAPDPPTILSPAPNSHLDVLNPLPDIVWRYNSVDGTEEQQHLVQYRLVGDSSWTSSETVAMPKGSHALEGLLPKTPGEYEVRVTVFGEVGSASSTVRYRLSYAPVFGFRNAPTTVNSNRASIEFYGNDAQDYAITGWQLDLKTSSGEIIETVRGTAVPSGPVTFKTLLDDASTYQVTGYVTASSGLTSTPSSISFTTQFLRPPVPVLDGQWSADLGATVLAITNPTPTSGQDATARNRIERGNEDIEYVTVFDDLPPNAGDMDRTVPLNTLIYYRVVAISELGVEQPGEWIEVETKSIDAWINWSNGHFRLECDITMDAAFDYGAVRHRLHNRKLFVPVYPLDHTPARSLSVSAALGKVSMERAEELFSALQQETILWRDLEQRVMWAQIDGVTITYRYGYPEVNFSVHESEAP